MIRMVLRKMISNRWMVLCLLLGLILAVAMVSSIPMYTNGVLQKMLIGDLENYQRSSGNYPGKLQIKVNFDVLNFSQDKKTQIFKMFDQKVTREMAGEFGLPILSRNQLLRMDFLTFIDERKADTNAKRSHVRVDALKDLDKHIEIVHGRMYSSSKQNGVYEIIVTEKALQDLDVILDQVYMVAGSTKERFPNPIKVKVVGVFKEKSAKDPFWQQGLYGLKGSFMMDYGLFMKDFIEASPNLLTHAEWYFGFDYHKMISTNLGAFVSAHESQSKWWYDQYKMGIYYNVPAFSIVNQYYKRAEQLKTTLWVIQVPILLMLAFYLFMVSQLVIEHEKNEIAVFKSRGASGLQVFLSYLLESSLLSGGALILGPPLGMLLCSILGSSNGFLEFVRRKALPVSLSEQAYYYSMAAVTISIITMLIPAFLSSRTNIVQYKQKKSRLLKGTLWKKFFLDIVLLLVAAYGLHSYNIRQETLELTGVQGTDLVIDPLLFVISTLFILGAGLLFLRVYPYLVRFVFWLGRKIWSPVLYASFVQVGRSSGQDQLLMLFIILTLAIGIYGANSARTINNNIEEKIQYEAGTDVVMQAYWESNRPSEFDAPPPGMNIPGSDQAQSDKKPIVIQYEEPPYLPFTEIEGIEKVTRVYRRNNAEVQIGNRTAYETYLMGIVPDEFGEVAWFRSDLLPYHWHQYLNLLSSDPKAVLLSSTFKEKFNVREGDSVYISWKGNREYFEGVVYAFVDYWPTFNPSSILEGDKKPLLVVGSLGYIQDSMGMEPYEVWAKKGKSATSEMIYKDIEEKGILLNSIQYHPQEVIIKKNDPVLMGTNGALTLGFIVTMTISTLGFLIYWILSIQKRILQFGIFRAMGLPTRKVIGMLIWEQILISGASVLIGIVIGGIASDLFVPLLQIIYSSAQQVPPFKVAASGMDYIRVYTIVGMMLTMGFMVLGVIISRIKIDQAIKLGED